MSLMSIFFFPSFRTCCFVDLLPELVGGGGAAAAAAAAAIALVTPPQTTADAVELPPLHSQRFPPPPGAPVKHDYPSSGPAPCCPVTSDSWPVLFSCLFRSVRVLFIASLKHPSLTGTYRGPRQKPSIRLMGLAVVARQAAAQYAWTPVGTSRRHAGKMAPSSPTEPADVAPDLA